MFYANECYGEKSCFLPIFGLQCPLWTKMCIRQHHLHSTERHLALLYPAILKRYLGHLERIEGMRIISERLGQKIFL